MKKNTYIKLISVMMSLVVLFGVISSTMVYAKSDNAYTNRLQMFFDDGNHAQLVNCPDAVYMEYADILRTDSKASIAMIALGIIYGGADYKEKIEPNKDQYMLALVNIMRTYESENAASMTEQNQMDNTKELKDYLFDVVDIELGITNVSGVWDEMKEEARIAISGMTQSLADMDDWSKGLAVLETTLQNYEKFDIFLQLVETNSEGVLKEAATDLRAGLSELMKTRLSTYGELLLGSAEKAALVFKDAIFDKAWMDWMKSIDVSNASKGYKWLTNYNIFYFDTLQWITLGVEIGKLVGNLSMGAEDVMAYIVEIKAVHDISVVLENELENIKYSFQKDNSEVTESDVQKYITYGNYLISCRLRGQYCMTAIYLQPSLRNLFSGDTAKNAESLYNRLTSNLLNIKKKLDAICSGTSLTQLLTGIEADSIQYYNCSESGNFAVIEKNGKYGIIGYDGNLILPIKYDRISRGGGYSYDFLLITESQDSWGSYVDKDGNIAYGYPDGGDVRPSSYWYDGGVVIFNADSDVMKLEEFLNHEWYSDRGLKTAGLVLDLREWNSDRLFPVQKISGYTNHNGYYHEPHIDTMQFALMDMNTHKLISDFIYEGVDDYNGVSEGLLAVKKDGKWGFVNEEGTVVVDCLYDPYESYTSNGETYEFVYTAVNGHIAVLKDGKWGLLDTQGNTVVEASYDGISQVNPDGMFWLKEKGEWSLYQIN